MNNDVSRCNYEIHCGESQSWLMVISEEMQAKKLFFLVLNLIIKPCDQWFH